MITVTDVWPVIQLIITNLSMLPVQEKTAQEGHRVMDAPYSRSVLKRFFNEATSR
jgi:hypothetical protein